ncbi:hypothetical protein [Magnetofaba australis]|uniref:Uncharacterized protein n=1 Tax=Magnetofaba australis IT-1 TaxID=1434232 RepID=A0A1Y2KAC8_9PROT|nr:hypothetical protein [Magnetofaba australis]OSM06874.1 hypothetical protein MAIT1_00248 [Magnetofaba australis IT-1]
MNDCPYLYLSIIPEALIASMLPPEEFGRYYATGAKVHVMGEAIFFDVDPTFRSDAFDFSEITKRCVAKQDGSPTKTIYLGIHDVLAKVPVEALGDLHLTTHDGKTLTLTRTLHPEPEPSQLRLYQEFAPVDPLVASPMAPIEFCKAMTDPANPVSVPRLFFCEFQLHGLATDPELGSAHDLPYPAGEHLRDILMELRDHPDKVGKMVLKRRDRTYMRMVRGGFYVGDQIEQAYYPLPDQETLERDHYSWWRSAQQIVTY